MPIVAALRDLADRPHARFYLPGHKGGQGSPEVLRQWWGESLWRADLPELPDFDNLFAPEAAIAAAQQLAAHTFGADRTWFLCNGSTAGVIAALSAVCRPGDRVLLPRNAHQSAIAGLIHCGARPVIAAPNYDAIWDLDRGLTPETVAQAIEHYPDLAAILVVSPNYYGQSCDLTAIVAIAHQRPTLAQPNTSFGSGSSSNLNPNPNRPIPVIVDAAHGSHFAFHPDLPASALACGADLVIESTHKTLGALSQAAMLHLQGDRVDPDRIDRALACGQSTSPNALLLASLDAARQQMAVNGRSLLDHTLALADRFRSGLRDRGWMVLDDPGRADRFDHTRITVRTADAGICGYDADAFLYARNVAAELPTDRHLTFVVTIGNTDADIDRALAAFRELEARRSSVDPQQGRVTTRAIPAPTSFPFSEPVIRPRDAFFLPSETIAITDSCGRLSAATLCPYPPGIPLLIPGERITQGAIEALQQTLAAGGTVTGWPTPGRLRVVCDRESSH
ncbi:MAG: arginine decarboxylase [Oscillatoriales cyanobacterium]|nr:MAG: arginine decarboxylase [Oscillatoriales cyanobacterium]